MYKARRCPPDEWEARYSRLGIDRVWRCARSRAALHVREMKGGRTHVLH